LSGLDDVKFSVGQAFASLFFLC